MKLSSMRDLGLSSKNDFDPMYSESLCSHKISV